MDSGPRPAGGPGMTVPVVTLKLMVWTAPTAASMCQDEVVDSALIKGTVHGTGYHDRIGPCEARISGARGRCGRQVVARKQLRRAEVVSFCAALPACPVGMEACGTAHYWARELSRLGHTVRLMPPAYVKPCEKRGPCVKRGKTDAADAAAIAEAVTRPTMRFVAVETVEQQPVLMLHKARALLVRRRTMLINALRGPLTEFGIIAARGPGGVDTLIAALHAEQDTLPELARQVLQGVVDQRRGVAAGIATADKRIMAWHRDNEASRRPAGIPGIGPITASAIAATVPDASLFRSGRQFAAWLGLTPRPHGSGGKQRLGGISRQGDGYICRLLVIGATAVLRVARQDNASKSWAATLLERKPARVVVAVALANKTARIAWALPARNQSCTPPAA
jgi:transposase